VLDIAIIGGGLSGLTLAHHLQQAGRDFKLFEARQRFGGRILSAAPSPANRNSRYDLGPSWIWPESQPRLARFTAQHAIPLYPHWIEGKALYQTAREAPPHAYVDYETYESARRISGGTYRLVEVLLQQLPSGLLALDHHLQQVTDCTDHVELQFNCQGTSQVVQARQAVLTIPPRLLADSVSFTPPLDDKLRNVMADTATWMAGHAKAVILYPRPFWREAGFSGNVLAAYQGAALAEIFDVCSHDGAQPALSGFFALPASLRSRYRDDLKALILDQLVRLFGKQAAEPQQIIIQDWFAEPLTASQADEVPPNGHPQYGHAWLQLDHWNDKLYFGGTETARQFGGYLEGALESAERIARSLTL
jgi:monoamine oxidase